MNLFTLVVLLSPLIAADSSKALKLAAEKETPLTVLAFENAAITLDGATSITIRPMKSSQGDVVELKVDGVTILATKLRFRWRDQLLDVSIDQNGKVAVVSLPVD